MPEPVVVSIEADAAPFEATLKQLEGLSAGFGRQLTNGLKSAVSGGKELDDILRRIGLNLAGLALDRALKPLQDMAGNFLSNLVGGLSGGSGGSPLAGLFPFAKGGVLGAPPPVKTVPFAAGGLVAAPTYFPLGQNLGLMGEAGTEAIMPLRRTADGRLGVAASGGGAAPVSVVFNVTSPDAASFRKSEAQITGMLARAVARGSRAL